jgi:hypothetical protein
MSGSYESASDSAKLQTTMLLEIIEVSPDGTSLAAAQLLRSGIRKAGDGSICRAFCHASRWRLSYQPSPKIKLEHDHFVNSHDNLLQVR